MDQMNRCFEGLSIQSHEAKDEHLAGKIISIIEMIDTVIIKPYSPNILLDFGTPLFLAETNSHNLEAKYILLGHIDDIFGPIGEPMYSVNLRCDLRDIKNINTYCFLDNPNTRRVCVDHIIDNISKNEKYNVRII